MKPRRIVRRSDGLVQIRRRRIRDVFIVFDMGVVAATCLACGCFVATLVVTLIASPLLLLITAAAAAPGLVAAWLARSVRLAPGDAA